ADSIKSSHLSATEIDILNKNVTKTISAIRNYTDSLTALAKNKNYIFRKYSIGKDLFKEKFKYDLATNFNPEEIYEKAIEEKKIVTSRMINISDSLWPKYLSNLPKPKDSIAMIQAAVDAVSLQN